MSEDLGTAHTVRVPAPLWAAARIRAMNRGETISRVVRRALEAYTAPEEETRA